MSSLLLRADYGDEYFLTKLVKTEFEGTIHSVFNHSFNLVEEKSGELFTLGHPNITGAPNTLIVSEAPNFSTVLKQGMPVMMIQGQLVIGSVIKVEVKEALSCDYRLTANLLNSERAQVNQTRVLLWLKKEANPGSFFGEERELSDFQLASQRLLKERTKRLILALGNSDLERAREAAKSLIGLGPGLTPSGDDFLLGLLAVMQMTGFPNEHYLAWLFEVVGLAKERTNLISYTALKKVSERQVKASLNNWLVALTQIEDWSVQEKAIKEVLAIGSTSGADIATGVLAGIGLYTQLIAKKSN